MMSDNSLRRSAALASIAVALLLLGLKGWAVLQTGSSAMVGSLADTLLDLAASMATLVGVWVAAQPADEGHRFGHGKAEAIAALFQVVLISISALAIAAHSVEQFLSGARVQSAGNGIAVSVVAMISTIMLLGWQRYVIRRTSSIAIATDHVHYQSDLLLNVAVIAALALDQYAGILGADSLFGVAIGGWLGWNAWKASRNAVTQLMDREWPEDKRRRLLELMAREPELVGVHDLRTRTSGNQDFAQFHVWVDPAMTVRDAHKVMDAIELRVKREFPDIEILIHPDPEGLVDEEGLAAEDVLPHMPHAGRPG